MHDDLATPHEPIATLIAEHLPRLRSRAVQLCRSRQDADDLVQDAVVRALRCQAQLQDRERARAWLLSIVTNLFLDRMRRLRARPRPVSIELCPIAAEPPEPTACEPQPWEDLDAASVRAAIDLLPADVRDTYRMFTFEGADYVAIAARQGIPKGTVGSRIVRARKRLRTILAARIPAAAAPSFAMAA